MKSIFSLRYVFVRQTALNDCGLACLAMILNYTGDQTAADSVRFDEPATVNGFSLLDLRNISRRYGLNARCVLIDQEFLRTHRSPVILHTVNRAGQEHFVVCLSVKQRSGIWFYRIADPAKEIYELPEDQMVRFWQSRGALLFTDLKRGNIRFSQTPWYSFLSISSFPLLAFFGIPFITICITFLGVALSWLLQRGINDFFTEQSTGLVAAVLILLFILNIFRNLSGFIKQLVLINLNSAVNREFMEAFTKRIIWRSGISLSDRSVRRSLADIQKIQNAVAGFVSVFLSDGALVLLLITGVFYYLPAAGFVNGIYIGIMTAVSARINPGLSLQTARISDLSAAAESRLIQEVNSTISSNTAQNRYLDHLNHYTGYITVARSLAVKLGRLTFFYECIGTVNVITILCICLFHLGKLAISYTDLMVIVFASYFIATLIPRICNAMISVVEGVKATHNFRSETPLKFR